MITRKMAITIFRMPLKRECISSKGRFSIKIRADELAITT
jgi:hypothetical protein